MATTIKVGGVTSATSAITPTGGTVLGSLVTIIVQDDGGITFADKNSNQRRMDYSPELHALMEQLAVGASGVASTQGWFGNTTVAATS
jgi:hypothetical protein